MTGQDVGVSSSLEHLCRRALEGVGYELVDLEYLRDEGGWTLRVFIDRPSDGREGNGEKVGISHADCALASRQLSAVLDVEDPIPSSYRLEVSSPGISRRVRYPEHFRRYLGRRVKVRMRTPLNGQRNLVGAISTVEEQSVTLALDPSGDRVTVPFESIRRAQLQEES